MITGQASDNSILEVMKTTLFINMHLVYLVAANYAGQEVINHDVHVYHMM